MKNSLDPEIFLMLVLQDPTCRQKTKAHSHHHLGHLLLAVDNDRCFQGEFHAQVLGDGLGGDSIYIYIRYITPLICRTWIYLNCFFLSVG